MSRLGKIRKLLDSEIRRKNFRALYFAAREAWWPVFRPGGDKPIFVVGCSRSGTTVTYETLAIASELRSFGYELPQFWNGLSGPCTNDWASEAAGADEAKSEFRSAALKYFYARLGSGRTLDKTCINVMRVPFLNTLFPDAQFVYIHRDGRDNVSSMMDGWRDGRFALSQFLGPFPEEVRINDGEFTEWHFFLPPGWRDHNRASLEEVCAYQWVMANNLALDAGEAIPPQRWIRVRYEDIFDRPVELFRGVYERLGLPFTDDIASHCASMGSRPTSIVSGMPARSKWRQRNPEAVERILPMLEPVMKRLGYSMAE